VQSSDYVDADVVHADVSVDMTKASEPVPSEEPSADHKPDISFPSTPGNRKKTIGKKRKVSKGESPKDSTFIDFDSEDDNPVVWERIVKWELIDSPTGQGQVNVIHRQDGTTKEFTFLSQILNMVDRQDILSLYGWVITYYESRQPEGIGMFLLGDLQVLCDSHLFTGVSFHVWKGQKDWVVDTWKFFPLPNVHMIVTTTGKTLYCWADVTYPIAMLCN
jgi:hypothetical protein